MDERIDLLPGAGMLHAVHAVYEENQRLRTKLAERSVRPVLFPPPTAPGYLTLEEAAAKLQLSVDTLERRIASDPSLPGGPVDFGIGKKRLLRFRADTLDTWVSAYEETRSQREATSTSTPAPKQRQKRKPPPKAHPGGDGRGRLTGKEIDRLRKK